MKMCCRVKSIGGSKFIIVNSIVVSKFKLKDGDVLLVDFIGVEV